MSAESILVTGGAGFIGSHLVDRLVELGYDVTIVDDLSSGQREHLNPKARFYNIDIRSPDLERALEEVRPKWVCHFAAQNQVLASLREPLMDADVNIRGSLNLLEGCRRHGIHKLIFASSGGAIYGEPDYLPCDESHPVRPLSPYGASKYSFEVYLGLYKQTYGLDYTVLRYANIFGPRQDPYGEAGVVAIFAKAMLDGRVPVINGSGDQERDFLMVDDAVESVALALEKGGGQVYNIGSGTGASVNRIFSLLKGISGYSGSVQHGPAKPGEVFKIHLDASLAEKDLGWSPRVSLEEGLSRTVDYFHSTVS